MIHQSWKNGGKIRRSTWPNDGALGVTEFDIDNSGSLLRFNSASPRTIFSGGDED